MANPPSQEPNGGDGAKIGAADQSAAPAKRAQPDPPEGQQPQQTEPPTGTRDGGNPKVVEATRDVPMPSQPAGASSDIVTAPPVRTMPAPNVDPVQRPVSPPPAPVHADIPQSRIGMVFGSHLLSILAAAVAFILFFGWVQESERSRQLDWTVSEALRAAALPGDGVDAARIQRVADDITAGLTATNAGPLLADSARRSAEVMLRDMARRPGASQSQRTALEACIPLLGQPAPPLPERSRIDACLLALDLAHAQAASSAPSPERLRAALEVVKQTREGHQEQRSYNLQTYQMVLLNLLLPLLTAIFGYVFGSQQGRREGREEAGATTPPNRRGG